MPFQSDGADKFEPKLQDQSLGGGAGNIRRRASVRESSNSLALCVARVIEATHRLSALPDRGNILTESIHDGDLLSAVNGPEKLLEALLFDKLKA